jgi:hypothetical protein
MLRDRGRLRLLSLGFLRANCEQTAYRQA